MSANHAVIPQPFSKDLLQQWERWSDEFGDIVFDLDKGYMRGESLTLPIKPAAFPQDYLGFLSALAETEIALRDMGYKVFLEAALLQPEIVVGRMEGEEEEYAFVSYLNHEDSSFSRIWFKRNQGKSYEVMKTAFTRYPFDNPKEFREALLEVKRNHPDAFGLDELEYPGTAHSGL